MVLNSLVKTNKIKNLSVRFRMRKSVRVVNCFHLCCYIIYFCFDKTSIFWLFHMYLCDANRELMDGDSEIFKLLVDAVKCEVAKQVSSFLAQGWTATLSMNINAKHALFNITAGIEVTTPLPKHSHVLVSFNIRRSFLFFECGCCSGWWNNRWHLCLLYRHCTKLRVCGSGMAWLLNRDDWIEAKQRLALLFTRASLRHSCLNIRWDRILVL